MNKKPLMLKKSACLAREEDGATDGKHSCTQDATWAALVVQVSLPPIHSGASQRHPHPLSGAPQPSYSHPLLCICTDPPSGVAPRKKGHFGKTENPCFLYLAVAHLGFFTALKEKIDLFI